MLPSKIMTMEKAAGLIKSGDFVAINGNMNMSPMGMVREIIRQQKKSLRLLSVSSGAINIDLLIGGGVIKSVEFPHVALGEFGLAPHFRKAIETGEIIYQDHVWPAILSGLRAGAMGLPFMPVRGIGGSDYLKVRPEFKTIDNPYDEAEKIVTVPALLPEVALFHAYQADAAGNVMADVEHNNKLLVQATGGVVLVTVEEIVPELTWRPQYMFIPGNYITAIVLAPGGAHPTSSPGYYTVDKAHIKEYVESSATDRGWGSYLDKYVYHPENPEAYNSLVHWPEIKEGGFEDD